MPSYSLTTEKGTYILRRTMLALPLLIGVLKRKADTGSIELTKDESETFATWVLEDLESNEVGRFVEPIPSIAFMKAELIVEERQRSA